MSAQICANCTAAYSVGAPQCPQCGANNPRADADAPTAPALTVRCPGRECPAYGKKRVVQLRTAAPGVVERPPLHCVECDRALETVTEEEEKNVPKTTVHGGATDATFDEEGEQPSPTPEAAGTASSTSSPKPSTTPETSETAPEKPARTTASRSKKAQTGSSSARGTAGDQTAPTSDDASDEG